MGAMRKVRALAEGELRQLLKQRPMCSADSSQHSAIVTPIRAFGVELAWGCCRCLSLCKTRTSLKTGSALKTYGTGTTTPVPCRKPSQTRRSTKFWPFR